MNLSCFFPNGSLHTLCFATRKLQKCKKFPSVCILARKLYSTINVWTNYTQEMDELYINRSAEEGKEELPESAATPNGGGTDAVDVDANGNADAVREEIVETAAEKMRSVGIRSVSIDDICRQLGISKKTFYVYFESKDQLVKEMLLLHEQKMEEKMLREVEGKSVVQILHEWADMAKNNEKDLEQPPPLMYDLQKYYPALCNMHKEHLCEMLCRNLKRFICKGQQEGVFRAELDADLTAQLFAYSHYLMMEQLQQYPKEREAIANIAVHGFKVMGRGIMTEQGLQAVAALQPQKPTT